MFQTLEIERQNSVVTIWMNRPDRHNAFDETLIAELTAAFQALESDESVRVVVLAGRGKSFSAGADLNWMQRAAGYTIEQNRAVDASGCGMGCTAAQCAKIFVARSIGGNRATAFIQTPLPQQTIAADIAAIALRSAATIRAVPVDRVPVDGVPVNRIPIDTVPVDTIPVHAVPVDRAPCHRA